MIGDINDPRIAAAIAEACGSASHSVRDRLERSQQRVAEGQAGPREESFTHDIAEAIDTMSDALKQSINTMMDSPTIAGTGVRVEFSTELAPQGEENAFGLDLGLRVIIETPRYRAEKAILIQCKRMYGVGTAGHFPKLKGDGEQQAEDMLKITPASFFFLFNAGPFTELLEAMRLGQSLPFAGPFGPPWFALDPGVAVVPATRVLALSQGARAVGLGFPTGALDILAGAVPLGQFVAGLFAPCSLETSGSPSSSSRPPLRSAVWCLV